MRVAILRTAMSIGPGSSSPIVDELFYPAMKAARKHEFPIQLVHQHDLACAVEETISRQLNGIFNIVGDGVVPQKKCRVCAKIRSGRGARRAGRLRRSVGAELAKYPLIVGANKFKQQAEFRFKYSSVRARESIATPSCWNRAELWRTVPTRPNPSSSIRPRG